MTKKWRWPVLNRGETANTRIPLLLEASSIIISTPPPIRLILTLIGHKSSQLERDRTQLTWIQPWLQLREICVHLESIFAPCSDFQLTALFSRLHRFFCPRFEAVVKTSEEWILTEPQWTNWTWWSLKRNIWIDNSISISFLFNPFCRHYNMVLKLNWWMWGSLVWGHKISVTMTHLSHLGDNKTGLLIITDGFLQELPLSNNI